MLIVPDLHWQEAGYQAVRLAIGLRARQCEVHICTWRERPDDQIALERGGVAFTSLDPPTVRNPRLLFLAMRGWHAFRPDVVHTFQAAGNRLGRLAARLLTRVPIFSNAHVGADDRSPLQRWLRTTGHHRAGKWIVPSETLAKHWAAAGVPAECLAVIRPAAVVPEPQPDAVAKLRMRLRLTPGIPVIVCVGPLLRRKGFTDAVWALDIMRQSGVEARLVIAGSGPEREPIATFARALEIEDAVTFLGQEEPRDVVLQLADIAWFPSICEDSPDSLLAALAAGRPVIATSVPGLAEFIADGRTGLLIPPAEQVLLTRQTCNLLKDAPQRAALGKNATEHIRQSHGFEVWVDRLLQLYRTGL